LLIFTVIFPFVKISALLTLWLKPGMNAQQMSRVHGFVSNMSKWSMLDVFVVAVLVVLIRSGGIATIKAQFSESMNRQGFVSIISLSNDS
jgi:paraquat-inducible protein A